MASELIRRVTCDVCHAEGAVEHSLTLDGAAWAIDLCGKDDGALAALMELLKGTGRLSRPARVAPRHDDTTRDGTLMSQFRTCARCGHTSPTRSALNTHVRVKHEALLSEVEGEVQCPRGDFVGTFAQLGHHSRREGHAITTGAP
jgi:hypothetical protein